MCSCLLVYFQHSERKGINPGAVNLSGQPVDANQGRSLLCFLRLRNPETHSWSHCLLRACPCKFFPIGCFHIGSMWTGRVFFLCLLIRTLPGWQEAWNQILVLPQGAL